VGEAVGIGAEAETMAAKEVDGFDVPECYGAALLHMGDGDINVQGDSQIVRDGEVNAG